jgi:hypothetical protein
VDDFTTHVLATIIGIPIGVVVALLLVNYVLEPLADWWTRTAWRIHRSYNNWRSQRRQRR